MLWSCEGIHKAVKKDKYNILVNVERFFMDFFTYPTFFGNCCSVLLYYMSETWIASQILHLYCSAVLQSSRRCFDGVWKASLLLELRLMHGRRRYGGASRPRIFEKSQIPLTAAWLEPQWWVLLGWCWVLTLSRALPWRWLRTLCLSHSSEHKGLWSSFPQHWEYPLNMWSCQFFWLASLSEDYCRVCCSDKLAGGMSVIPLRSGWILRRTFLKITSQRVEQLCELNGNLEPAFS